jgi:hypothetical protein
MAKASFKTFLLTESMTTKMLVEKDDEDDVNAPQKIKWIRPRLADDVDEYTKNKDVKKFFKSKGLEFEKETEVLDFLKTGKSVSMTKKVLMKKTERLTFGKEFHEELDKTDFVRSYEALKDKINAGKSVSLPQAVLVKFGNLIYGFAGERRINLALETEAPLKVWLITWPPKKSSDDSSEEE